MFRSGQSIQLHYLSKSTDTPKYLSIKTTFSKYCAYIYGQKRPTWSYEKC